MVRVLVCGGRAYPDKARVYRVLDSAIDKLGLTEIVQGGATGADFFAHQWAKDRGIPDVPDAEGKPFKADWRRFLRAAGPIRNAKMLAEAKPDLVIAFFTLDAPNDGTTDMCEKAEKAGIRVIKA